jgi:lysophospholipase L1-like esterase
VEPVRLAVLGDSIAYGQGAARAADAAGPRLVAALEAAGYPAELRVVAVPGAQSSGLAAQVTRACGWSPEVVVIVIGANDLTHFVQPAEAAAHLERAVRRLRDEGAAVIVAPAPDLSVVPWVPPVMRAAVHAASQQLRAAQVQHAVAAGARIADAQEGTRTAFATDPNLFSADRFHPSSAGYAVIAAALAPEVLAAVEERRSQRAV